MGLCFDIYDHGHGSMPSRLQDLWSQLWVHTLESRLGSILHGICEDETRSCGSGYMFSTPTTMVMGVCLQDDDTHGSNQRFVLLCLQENGTFMHMDYGKEMKKLKMRTMSSRKREE